MARRALLIGIDVYPDPRNNLNSCVADTLAFRNLLISQFNFQPSEITLLHNANATLAGARAGLDALFAGAQAGDTLVFFESSHGYRYPDGDTMVEVLCLYDAFLQDTELVDRAKDLPPGVFTAVLDSCHSGGMNKLFLAPGGAQLIRAKVWQPDAAAADRTALLSSQVTRFKFFGRAATGDSGAVAKNLYVEPAGIPLPKDADEGGSELNGVLLAACQADETAAAGSPATDNLSAFTFGIVSETKVPIAARTLTDRVVARLKALNMAQTPVALAPAAQPTLLDHAFVTLQAMDPAGAGSGTGNGSDPGTDTDTFDPWEWLQEQLSGAI